MYILVRETPSGYGSSGDFEMLFSSKDKNTLEDKRIELEIAVDNNNKEYQKQRDKEADWYKKNPLPNHNRNDNRKIQKWFTKRLELMQSLGEYKHKDESYFIIYEIPEI